MTLACDIGQVDKPPANYPLVHYLDVLYHGGFTADPHTGRVPDKGYVVNVSWDEIEIPENMFTPASVLQHLNRTTWSADEYQGGWLHNNTVHLGKALVLQDLDEALRLAHGYHQLAIYNLHDKKDIYLKGA